MPHAEVEEGATDGGSDKQADSGNAEAHTEAGADHTHALLESRACVLGGNETNAPEKKPNRIASASAEHGTGEGTRSERERPGACMSKVVQTFLFEQLVRFGSVHIIFCLLVCLLLSPSLLFFLSLLSQLCLENLSEF
jgi:hypothetical protein